MPEAPHLALWWAATALREFRGDSHVAALVTAGVDGCEANLITVALGLAPPEQRLNRGWSEAEWQAAHARLRDRGVLSQDGTLTDAGRLERDAIEATTDRLARPLLGDARLAECLRPLAWRIVGAGGVPFPNAMGLPPLRPE